MQTYTGSTAMGVGFYMGQAVGVCVGVNSKHGGQLGLQLLNGGELSQ